MSRFDKWLTGVGKSCVSAAARKALRSRLKAVEHYLRAAAHSPASRIEPVHQLRVWCRRAASALKIFEPVVPRKKFKWFQRKLKKIRRAAGAARDCDVLLARLKQEPPSAAGERLAKALAKRRKSAKPPLVELHKSLGTSGKLKHKTEKLLDKLAWRGNDGEPQFAEWCPTSLAPVLSDFLRHAQRRITGPAALHALRISGKHLRYALELTAACYAPGVRERIYPELSEFQDRLGQVCDHLAAQQHFRELQSAADSADDRQFFQAVANNEQKLFETTRAQFLRWWSTSRKRAFAGRGAKFGLLPPTRQSSQKP
jgi:CHAD domain-containing protein